MAVCEADVHKVDSRLDIWFSKLPLLKRGTYLENSQLIDGERFVQGFKISVRPHPFLKGGCSISYSKKINSS